MARILIAVIVLFTGFSAFADKLPVEAFYKSPDIQSLRISPDGKHFAATVKVKGDKKLAILDVKTKQIKQLFSFSQGYREIGNIGWFNNERVFAEMVRKVGPLAQASRTGYLFAGNIDGSKKSQILPRPSAPGRTSERPQNFRIVNYLNNEPDHVLVSMADGKFEKIYKLNTYTGAKTTFEKSPVKYASLVLDHKGIARAVEQNHPDDEKYRIFLRNSKNMEWELFKEFDAKNIGMDVLRISPDLKNLIIRVNEKGKTRGLYNLDLATKAFTLMKEIPGDADIEGNLFHYNKDLELNEIIGFRQMPGYIEDTYFDDKHEGVIFRKSLQDAFPGLVVDLIDTIRDGSKTLIRTWSDRNPGTYYLFDNKTYSMEYLLDSVPWLKPSQLAPMEAISFKARDGLEIRGYLTRPIGKKKDLPMVVYVHGGPYGVKDSWGYDRDAQFLANRGYAVMQLNYRGSGGRGSDFIYDNYKKVGREMQDDLTDGTMWAVEQGIADKERLCLYGASYGGYAAMMGIIREPDLYKCTIPYVGVYDIRAFKYDIYHKTKYGRRNEKRAWGYGDEEFMSARSPVDNLKDINAAIFLVHGKDDKICPIEHYDRLTEKLEDMNYPYDSLVKPFEGHGFRDEKNNFELYTKIEAFLEKHIGK